MNKLSIDGSTTKMIPLIGYAEQLSGSAGDVIDFKVSSVADTPYQARLIRIVCADPNPAGPGLIEHAVPGEIESEHPSIVQPIHPGSYAFANFTKQTLNLNGFTFSATIYPTIATGRLQVILSVFSRMSNSAWSLAMNEHQQLVFLDSSNGFAPLVSEVNIRLKTWQTLFTSYDPEKNLVQIGRIDTGKKGKQIASDSFKIKMPTITVTSISIAAEFTPLASHHFNGKIEAPRIFNRKINTEFFSGEEPNIEKHLVCGWDFSENISSTAIPGIGLNANPAQLVNFPARAMMSSQWDGSERNWVHKPKHYAAIHFHEDDIYDFGWSTSFSYTIPEHLQSGCYAVKITNGEFEDKIPFFVSSKPGKPKAKICLLVSTFTYVIYGNHARPDYTAEWQDHFARRNGYRWNPAAYPHYGLSTYNIHLDGSGICHACHRRPLLNLRSGYITFGNTDCSGLRHFQADSHLISWLEKNKFAYDLITDQELQNSGYDILKHYDVLVTGSHPEYHTPKMLDAIETYRNTGGHLIYLGGNGFYWKIAEHAEHSGTLEVRRAEGGIRAWAAEPGEYYQAFDGSYGGLWRRNNRPPQQIAGIGFSAQGKFTGSYYRRSKASFHDNSVNWVFKNIEEEIIGDFGLCGFGAAGFELDRMDVNLGSDENCTILASSENHDEDFVLVPEELLTHITNCPGEPVEKLIRADIVYQENDTGSRLFATGSITFCGSLLHNDCKNNISVMLSNVISNFTE